MKHPNELPKGTPTETVGVAGECRNNLAQVIARVFHVPRPDETVSGWHVSPLIDIVAYHWSWLWMLGPLLCMGNGHPTDYRWLFILVLCGNFTHQAISVPFVYFDRAVFRRDWKRFTLLPLGMLAAFFVMLALFRYDRVVFLSVFLPISVATYTWNFWHVFMQKFGFLRLYNAKAASNGVPAWVDKLFVFGWLPLYLPVFAMSHGEFLLKNYKGMKPVLGPLIVGLVNARWFLMPLTVTILVASIVLFLRHEWMAHRWQCLPRLSMALGLTCLGASLILFNPIKGVIAFGFSHVVEYFVFAWAFQRRCYHEALPHRSVLGRLMARPTLAFAVFIIVVGGAYALVICWRDFFPGRPPMHLGGYSMLTILSIYTIFQAMVHFYFDGLLWKIRRPDVRAHI